MNKISVCELVKNVYKQYFCLFLERYEIIENTFWDLASLIDSK